MAKKTKASTMSKKSESKQSTTTDVAVIDTEFAVVQANQSIGELIAENLGGEKLTPSDLDRVKVPSGGGTIFEVPGADGVEAATSLDCVILYTKLSRAYWADSNADGSPPDCFSSDSIRGHGVMADKHDGLCENCPMSKFGSKVSDDGDETNAQACKQVRQLFFVREHDRLPMTISLPPTSLKAAKQYLLRLARNGVSYTDVMTRMTLEKDKSESGIAYSRVILESAGRLPAEVAAAMKQAKTELKPVFDATRAVVEG